MTFGSDEEYAASRNDPAVWFPTMRRVLDRAGLPSAGPLRMLTPAQHPAALAEDLDAVVTVYSGHWGGYASFRRELDAHRLLSAEGLPVPPLLAHGPLDLWDWIVERAADGASWSRIGPSLTPSVRAAATTRLGRTLQRWHRVRHDNSMAFGAGWRPFLLLINERLRRLQADDDRLAALPVAMHPALRELAASTVDEVDPGWTHGCCTATCTPTTSSSPQPAG